MEWKDLSIKERAELIKLGTQNGLRDINDIREFYNKYANGGNIKDEGYYNWLEKEAEVNSKRWGMSTDEAFTKMANDNEYNYRAYYEDQIVKGKNGHYTDKYKTAYHPTFSNESMYSGKQSQYNPKGLIGGSWGDKSYNLSQSQKDNNWDIERTQNYLNIADPGYTAYAKGGKVNRFDDGGENEIIEGTEETEVQPFKFNQPSYTTLVTDDRKNELYEDFTKNKNMAPGGEYDMRIIEKQLPNMWQFPGMSELINSTQQGYANARFDFLSEKNDFVIPDYLQPILSQKDISKYMRLNKRYRKRGNERVKNKMINLLGNTGFFEYPYGRNPYFDIDSEVDDTYFYPKYYEFADNYKKDYLNSLEQRPYDADFNREMQELNMVFEFMNSYYESLGFKDLTTKSGVIYPYVPKTNASDVIMYEGDSRDASNRKRGNSFIISFPFSIQDFKDKPLNAWFLAHEMAHNNPLFNTSMTYGINPESPYYNLNYDYLPDEWKELLRPLDSTLPTEEEIIEELRREKGAEYIDELLRTREDNGELDDMIIDKEQEYFKKGRYFELNDHDKELAENYSDLLATKAMLYAISNGEWDARKEGFEFTQEMIDTYVQYLKDHGYESNRFFNTHTPENVLKALNTIAMNAPQQSPFQINDNTYLA